MARNLVNGTIPSIGATFGTSTNITAITNAVAAVATFAAGHGIVVGDYVEISASGWPAAANQVYRASAVSTNDITLLGLETSSTTLFPAGAGAGSTGRRIITWAAIQQANKDQVKVSGGDPEYETGQYIDSKLKFRYPTSNTPIDVEMIVDDDQTLAYWATVNAAALAQSNYPIRFAYPGGAGFAVGTGIWSKSAAPDLSGPVRRRTISVAMAGIFTEYTS